MAVGILRNLRPRKKTARRIGNDGDDIDGQPLDRNRIVGTWIPLARLTAVEILRNLSAQIKAARLGMMASFGERLAPTSRPNCRHFDSIIAGLSCRPRDKRRPAKAMAIKGRSWRAVFIRVVGTLGIVAG